VIAVLRNAESLIIFGPGEGKIELKKRLVKNKLGALIAAVESEDKMTDRQISAKVREYFSAGARI
jgi:50S ribosomal subunit-associated GTPase HflX